jgi:hypothetical protein
MHAELPVEPPRHPLYALTTYELRDYRRALEIAIACADEQDPVPTALPGLHDRLDAVLAEQASRTKLAASGRTGPWATGASR